MAQTALAYVIRPRDANAQMSAKMIALIRPFEQSGPARSHGPI
jgi:hypothetical protein